MLAGSSVMSSMVERLDQDEDATTAVAVADD